MSHLGSTLAGAFTTRRFSYHLILAFPIWLNELEYHHPIRPTISIRQNTPFLICSGIRAGILAAFFFSTVSLLRYTTTTFKRAYPNINPFPFCSIITHQKKEKLTDVDVGHMVPPPSWMSGLIAVPVNKAIKAVVVLWHSMKSRWMFAPPQQTTL